MRTVAATHDLVPAFLARIEPARRQRLHVMPGNGPGWLERLIDASDFTWCGIDERGPVYMGGVLKEGPLGRGYVWQNITPDIALHKRAYLLQQRAIVEQAKGRHAVLTTLIEADNELELRHLRRNGARIGEPFDLNGHRCRLCERTV